LVEKLEGKRPLARTRRRIGYYFKMEVKIQGNIVDCIYSSQDMYKAQAAMNTVMKLRVL
jgi:hypothetical protein